MTFFDTLKDKNVKALFQVLAMDEYGRDGKAVSQVMEELSFEQRLEIFTLVHKLMKAVGMPGWQEPQYLNRDHSEHYYDVDRNKAHILDRKTRPDND